MVLPAPHDQRRHVRRTRSRLVRPLYRILYRAVYEKLGDSKLDLTVADRAFLERLHDAGPQPVPEVARWLDLGWQPVQRVADRLAERRLVRRVPNPRSLKSPLYELALPGAEAIRQVLAREAVELKHAARELDAAALEAAIRVVGQLIGHFERAGR